MEEEFTCRICFEPQTNSNDRLISPCLCSGTQKYIHESCLQTWRLMQPFRAHQCDVCHFVFLLSHDIDPYIETFLINVLFAATLVTAWVLLAFACRNKEYGFFKSMLQVFTLIGILFFLSYWSFDYPFISSILLLTGPISVFGLGPFLVALDGYFRSLPHVYESFAHTISRLLHADQYVIDREDIVVN